MRISLREHCSRRITSLLLAAAGLLSGCDSEGVSPFCRPGVPAGAGFPSNLTLLVSSEATPLTLAVLSLDQVDGRLGVVGGPLDVNASISDAETLAADEANRRIYLGSDLSGTVAVVTMDGTGKLTPVSGSPFSLEAPQPTVVRLNTASNVAYVGYRDQSFLSRYPIDPATGALGSALPKVPINGTFIETMQRLGDLLYVICNTTSNILAFRIEADGTLTDLGVNVPLDPRPDYIDFVTDSLAGTNRLYVSLTAGSIDAFDVNTATGALARLPGAPYPFPGLTTFELLRASPDGQFIAVGSERPPAAGLLRVESDGSLTPVHSQVMSEGTGGPEGMVWTPNGRFLLVANHLLGGIHVYERVGELLRTGPVPCYTLPGRPIDLVMTSMAVNP
ncbi:MAG: beta-propeller fold lactonase family protein [Planctomycetota bacterium]